MPIRILTREKKKKKQKKTETNSSAGDERHQGGADHPAGDFRAHANCWKRSGWNSAPPLTWK